MSGLTVIEGSGPERHDLRASITRRPWEWLVKVKGIWRERLAVVARLCEVEPGRFIEEAVTAAIYQRGKLALEFGMLTPAEAAAVRGDGVKVY